MQQENITHEPEKFSLLHFWNCIDEFQTKKRLAGIPGGGILTAMDELKKKFIVKYIFLYFLYGHLFFLGMVISVTAGIKIFMLCSFPFCCLAVLSLIPFGICAKYYIRILSTTKFKWKFYRVSSYRIRKRTFDEEWFCDYMNEPCMRLIIRDLCFEYGYRDEYRSLYKRYAHVNHYLEVRKMQLIEEVKRKNEKLS